MPLFIFLYIMLGKLVITGGPCAGKSSVVAMLKDEFGDEIITVPEPATLLLAGGFPAPGKHLDYSHEWQYAFQKSVLTLHRSLEEAFALMGAGKSAKLLVCDNGLPSGAAYMPGGVKEFERMYGIDFAKEIAAYDAVIHFETIALSAPEKYGRHNNEHRYTTIDQAIKHDEILKRIWSSHPKHFVMPSGWSLEDKYHKAREIVSSYLQ